jgi:hypothetical protein
MPFPKKPPVQRKCSFCGKIVLVKNKRAAKFKFCSNECKNKVKEQQLPHNKIPPTFIKCTSVFCNKGKFYKPWQLKKGKNKFCSNACFRYYISKQYKLDLVTLQERKQVDVKHNIWRL